MGLTRKRCAVQGCDRWAESKGIGPSGKRLYRTVCTVHHRRRVLSPISYDEVYRAAKQVADSKRGVLNGED